MSRLTPEREAAIRDLLEKAGPGSWSYDAEDGEIEHENGGLIGLIQDHGSVHTVMRTGEPRCNAHGHLIVALRNDFPALLAELDRVRPVYEAAVAWRAADIDPATPPADGRPLLDGLADAIDKAEGRTG